LNFDFPLKTRARDRNTPAKICDCTVVLRARRTERSANRVYTIRTRVAVNVSCFTRAQYVNNNRTNPVRFNAPVRCETRPLRFARTRDRLFENIHSERDFRKVPLNGYVIFCRVKQTWTSYNIYVEGWKTTTTTTTTTKRGNYSNAWNPNVFWKNEY